MEQPTKAKMSGNTVADAIALLEEHCGCLFVQLEIVPSLWKVFSRDHTFEAVFSDTELIAYARAEHERHTMVCAGLGPDAAKPLAMQASHLSARPTHQTKLSEWPCPPVALQNKEVSA